MKKTLTLITLMGLLSFSLSAQVAKYGETTQRGFYDSYIAKDGTHYKSGDKLKLGSPQSGHKTFTHIQFGNDLGGYTPLDANKSGIELYIDKFYVNGKNFGYKISFWMRVEGVNVVKYLVLAEDALESGELIGFGMTSDQALQELKKWKDKFDLELITKEEYEAKKQELSKFIK